MIIKLAKTQFKVMRLVVRKIERSGVYMKNAINEMKLQLNYVCYDKEMIPKLSKVWDAFFKLEEAFNSSHNKKSTPCPLCGKPWDLSKCNTCSCGAFFKRL